MHVLSMQSIGEFYSPGSVMEKDQTVVTPFECATNIHSCKRCFSIFANLSTFDANFDPLYSSKLNGNMCIL